MTSNTQTVAAAAVITVAAWVAAPAPVAEATAAAMLAAIVEADRAAMEANDLVGLGVLDYARYEALARARDEAIDRAAEFLNR